MNAFSSALRVAHLKAIDRADSRSGMLRREKPHQWVSHHLPSSRPTADMDAFSQAIVRHNEVWTVRHDDGTELFRGSRREASAWVDSQERLWERTYGSHGHDPAVVALMKSEP